MQSICKALQHNCCKCSNNAKPNSDYCGRHKNYCKESSPQEEWIKNGKSIPACINKGCYKQVMVRHWTYQKDPSLKTECGTCSTARIRGKTLDNIFYHKKKYCENKDNMLGFKCPLDNIECKYEYPDDIYDMDHLDGNHQNNTPCNVITICKICHTTKGKQNGDFNAHKKSSRLKKSNISNELENMKID
jgi:hypothetical protein